MQDESQTYSEFLRLAVVAASDAAESEVSRIELDPNDRLENHEQVDGVIKIDGRCKLARFFKDHGEKFEEEEGTFYVFDNACMVKWEDESLHDLKFEYSMHEKHEKPVVEKAIEAIMHVLSQIEANLEFVIEPSLGG